jgi:hypothetical protein
MEVIILLLIFILIPLANYALERMRRRYQPPPSSSGRIPDMGMRRQAAPPAPPSVISRERLPEAPATPVQRSRSHHRGNRLFRNKRDVRRVIIAMTVLGPCRAYDRPDY